MELVNELPFQDQFEGKRCGFFSDSFETAMANTRNTYIHKELHF